MRAALSPTCLPPENETAAGETLSRGGKGRTRRGGCDGRQGHGRFVVVVDRRLDGHGRADRR